MNHLTGYGITLKQLDFDSIQLVRKWRNQDQIRSQMEFQEVISESEQVLWFQKLDKKVNQYFIIQIAVSPVGLIHLKNIDLKNKIAESGLFIGDNAFVGTGVSLGASILLLDYAFNQLNLQTIQAKVQNENTIAQQYNQLLGFTIKEKINDHFSLWELAKGDFEILRKNLIKISAAIQRLTD
jgi:UDP-4-amino-4,6-dideoxy-N-acetyl-beta-L-altrosamine N-acetyltransferase